MAVLPCYFLVEDETKPRGTVPALELVLAVLRGPERDGEVVPRSRVPVVRGQRTNMATGRSLEYRAWQHAFRAAVLVGAELTNKQKLKQRRLLRVFGPHLKFTSISENSGIRVPLYISKKKISDLLQDVCTISRIASTI